MICGCTSASTYASMPSMYHRWKAPPNLKSLQHSLLGDYRSSHVLRTFLTVKLTITLQVEYSAQTFKSLVSLTHGRRKSYAFIGQRLPEFHSHRIHFVLHKATETVFCFLLSCFYLSNNDGKPRVSLSPWC